MPPKPFRVCTYPPCQSLTRLGYCEDCQAKGRKKERRRKGEKTGHEKSRWTKLSEWFREQNPYCEECTAKAKARGELSIILTEVTHHIKAVDRDDPLFYIVENLQALCRDCHEKKHGRRK